MKKGQATLFIVLGIIIVAVIGVTYYYKDSVFSIAGLGESLSYPSEMDEVAEYTEDCLDNLAENVVLNISFQAGEYQPDEELSYYFGLGTYIPYAYYDEENHLIEITEMERNMAQAMDDELETLCYDQNVYLEEFSLKLGDTETEVTINEENVEFVIEFPLSGEAGEGIYDLVNSYDVEVEARVGYVHSAASNIIDLSVEDPEYFDLAAIAEQGVDVELLQMDNFTHVFVIRDDESLGDVMNYTFIFAGSFPEREVEEDEGLLELIGETE